MARGNAGLSFRYIICPTSSFVSDNAVIMVICGFSSLLKLIHVHNPNERFVCFSVAHGPCKKASAKGGKGYIYGDTNRALVLLIWKGYMY